ncbi:hypothetical protein MSG28_016110 [Choristoneura fumiferana]|uniref:Uncharacterized protein n=1 Tax=Choristoneura fumiferana TaxID=7141 RepID=A0ACC0K5F2_CHOFU|nr:hypothetical protein MSG28_016110 [Choristoneura fumiferana]
MELLKVEETEELQACRICLATDTELYSILEHRLENAFVEIMGTMLSAWDGFPQHVCAWCRRLLRKSAEFRARGRRAHDALARLARSQALTTECVRSVDRAALRLPLPLASVAAAPALCCWHELKQEAPEPEVPLKEEEVLLEHYTETWQQSGTGPLDFFELASLTFQSWVTSCPTIREAAAASPRFHKALDNFY